MSPKDLVTQVIDIVDDYMYVPTPYPPEMLERLTKLFEAYSLDVDPERVYSQLLAEAHDDAYQHALEVASNYKDRAAVPNIKPTLIQRASFWWNS